MTRKVSESGRGVALYVHVPFCTAKCPYCGFYSVPVTGQDVPRLTRALLRELDSYKLPKDFAHTIYIGGGSPTCIPDEHLFFLISELVARAGKPDEFTIEANPTQVSAGILSTLHSLGINRLSIGAQSFDADQLKFLGRPYVPKDIVKAVADGRAAGFTNISLDLIFAIPGQTLKTWRNTLKSAIGLGVEHISAYSLSYEKDTPLTNRLKMGDIDRIDEDIDRKMYETVIKTLNSRRIPQYEISNFARRGFECQHNLVYWANRSWIGIGPGAASYWQESRTTNVSDVAAYIGAIEQGENAAAETETPDALETACQTAVLNLRRTTGINLNEFEMQTGFNAMDLFSEPIARYKSLGLIAVAADSISLTADALPIADSILCDFVSVE
jgi:oxygen-independent coproporphyrinogen III oxidase